MPDSVLGTGNREMNKQTNPCLYKSYILVEEKINQKQQ